MFNQPKTQDGGTRAYYWIDGRMKEDVFKEFAYKNWMWTDGTNMCNLKKLVAVDACLTRKCKCLKLQLFQGSHQTEEKNVKSLYPQMWIHMCIVHLTQDISP